MDTLVLGREFERAASRFGGMKIGVIGDFAVDAYWMLDGEAGELSVETGQRAFAVASQRYSLGGAGNVAANLAALGVGTIQALGVRGDDLYGGVLTGLLQAIGVDTGGLLVQGGDWDTHVWAKPHVEGRELRRLDFGFFNRLDDSTRRNLLDSLAGRIAGLDALIVNRQLPHPVIASGMIALIGELAARFPEKLVIADSREDIGAFGSMVQKIDQASLLRHHFGLEKVDQDAESYTLDDVRRAAGEFFAGRTRPVVITRGRRGCLVYDNGRIDEVPAIYVPGEVDPVGAGDAMLAALTACLAAGMDVREAALIGNYAAAVTVAKLHQTGSASPREIASRIEEARLVFRPDLAEHPERAVFVPGSSIEVADGTFPRGQATHVIFDHDGTISNLRRDWEPVMEQVMLEAITGGRELPEKDMARVREWAIEYIDQSTGLQTIVQMHELAAKVAAFGFVPEAGRLDPLGYKAGYNDKLLVMVNERLRAMDAGEIGRDRFIVSSVVELMRELRSGGATLYLASGTDQDDVIREAKILGYADMFNGGIYGSVGDVKKFDKRMLIARLIDEHGIGGADLLTFGDGPVEISETVKRGGVAVGVASDETHGEGINPLKRPRLIKAGAHLVVGDYREAGLLLDILTGKTEIQI